MFVMISFPFDLSHFHNMIILKKYIALNYILCRILILIAIWYIRSISNCIMYDTESINQLWKLEYIVDFSLVPALHQDNVWQLIKELSRGFITRVSWWWVYLFPPKIFWISSCKFSDSLRNCKMYYVWQLNEDWTKVLLLWYQAGWLSTADYQSAPYRQSQKGTNPRQIMLTYFQYEFS